MELLLCADDTLTYPLQVLLYNIAKATPDSVKESLVINFGYLREELSESNLLSIQYTASILELNLSAKECPPIFSDWLEDAAWKSKPLTSLIPSWFLTNSSESFLYLDIDVLLLEGWHTIFEHMRDLSEWQMPLAMVKDPNIKEFPRALLDDDIIKKVLNSGEKRGDYFNSGVMLFNSQVGRKPDISTIEKFWKRCKTIGRPFMDQDVINVVYQNKIVSIADDYNLFCCDPYMWKTSRRLSSLKPPKILHFAGPKPYSYSAEEKRNILDTINQVPLSQPFRLAQIQYFLNEFEFRTFRSFNS